MSRAYTVLDKESVAVADAADLSAKVLDQSRLMGPLREKMDQLSHQSDIVNLHMQAENDRRIMSEPADEYENATMRMFREQARDTMYNMRMDYNGTEPTEEMQVTAMDKMATILAYTIMKIEIRQMKPEVKAAAYQKLEQHPEILENLKQGLLRSDHFKEGYQECFSENMGGYLHGLQSGPGGFGVRISKIRTEVMTNIRAEMARKDPAPEVGRQNPVQQMEDPLQQAQIPQAGGLAPM